MKAVIMAGGQGTRFWPASRRTRPKQFLSIGTEQSLFQQTLQRLQPLVQPADIYVVTGAEYLEQIRAQAPFLSHDQLIVEPLARNTAACIGLAALYLSRSSADAVMAVLPSDHVIGDVNRFHAVLKAAERLARQGWLVTFGIRPSFPSTGYGYIERAESLGDIEGQEAFRVARFLEKPKLEKAQELIASGRFDWNSGIFVWQVRTILEQIQKLMPELHNALEQIRSDWDDRDRQREVFSALPSSSVDVGIMEKADRVASIPCDLGWNDVGNWRALEDVLEVDQFGNVSNVRLLSMDSSNSVIYASQGKLVALLGVQDLIVVETPDAVLICNRQRTEEVKQLVDKLKQEDLERYL